MNRAAEGIDFIVKEGKEHHSQSMSPPFTPVGDETSPLSGLHEMENDAWGTWILG